MACLSPRMGTPRSHAFMRYVTHSCARGNLDALALYPAGVTRTEVTELIVIGAQKAGTTSVHEWLLQHPGIHLPASKEAHYFTLDHDKTVQWYAKHYAGAQRGQLRGDITPYYAYHPYAAERIAALLPAVRLVYLVRDPVERTISHYFHEVRRGNASLSIGEALAVEPARLEGAEERLRQSGSQDLTHQCYSSVARSRYEVQIQHSTLFCAIATPRPAQ